jgi:hypothetical protein
MALRAGVRHAGRCGKLWSFFRRIFLSLPFFRERACLPGLRAESQVARGGDGFKKPSQSLTYSIGPLSVVRCQLHGVAGSMRPGCWRPSAFRSTPAEGRRRGNSKFRDGVKEEFPKTSRARVGISRKVAHTYYWCAARTLAAAKLEISNPKRQTAQNLRKARRN